MITAKSYAKINLSLDLVGKREDGYHLLRSVMQKITLCDIISAKKIPEGIKITCNKPFIPSDEKNVVYKTAAAFFEKTKISGGVHINIKKHIPTGAGLGGGSSNGAAAIDLLCNLYGVKMSKAEKNELTKNIGADIPFFFYSATALCEGIGEKVTELENSIECWYVIVKPPKSISTPTIYKHPITAENFGGDSTEKVITALKSNNLQDLCKNMKNALQPASEQVCPEIKNLVLWLVENGASAAMMSGSGSAVFGVFTKHKFAKKAKDALAKQYKNVYIAKPVV